MNVVGQTRGRFVLPLPREVRLANIPEHRKQPGLDGVPAVKTTQRAAKTSFDGIFCVRSALHQEESQPIGVIEAWKRGLSKTSNTIGYGFVMLRHHNLADRFT